VALGAIGRAAPLAADSGAQEQDPRRGAPPSPIRSPAPMVAAAGRAATVLGHLYPASITSKVATALLIAPLKSPLTASSKTGARSPPGVQANPAQAHAAVHAVLEDRTEVGALPDRRQAPPQELQVGLNSLGRPRVEKVRVHVLVALRPGLLLAEDGTVLHDDVQEVDAVVVRDALDESVAVVAREVVHEGLKSSVPATQALLPQAVLGEAAQPAR